MKILITGSGGQLGSDCNLVLGKKHTLYSLSSSALDISSKEHVRITLIKIQPDVVINCAAYTAVDNCEKDTERCFTVNAKGPQYLAQTAEEIKARFFHISTDYVFDGKRTVPTPYLEKDSTNPLSAYGKAKLAGEKAIQEACSNHLIIRTAWLYGIGGKNFLKTMLRLAVARPQKTIRIVDDQFGSLTWTYRLARQIEKLLDSDLQGIVHATAEGCSSWFEGAKTFLEAMGIDNFFIEPCTTADYPTPAIRPANSILENGVLKANNCNIMHPWQDDVIEFANRYRHLLLDEAAAS